MRAELREGARLKGQGRAERKGRDCVRGVAKRRAGLNVEKQLSTRGWGGAECRGVGQTGGACLGAGRGAGADP